MKTFLIDFVDNATASSLPTASQPALFLKRGINGNQNVFKISKYLVYHTLKYVPVSI